MKYQEIKELHQKLNKLGLVHKYEVKYNGAKITIGNIYTVFQSECSKAEKPILLEVFGLIDEEGNYTMRFLTSNEVIQLLKEEGRVNMEFQIFDEIQQLHEKLIKAGVIHTYSILADKRCIRVNLNHENYDYFVVTQSKVTTEADYSALGLLCECYGSQIVKECFFKPTASEVFSCILFLLSTF